MHFLTVTGNKRDGITFVNQIDDVFNILLLLTQLLGKAQEAELELQIQAELAREEEIAELENYIGSDEYVEDVAKDKLGLINPNEIIFTSNCTDSINLIKSEFNYKIIKE